MTHVFHHQPRAGAMALTGLMPGSKLPPLILTDQEAVAVSVGLLFARQLARVSFHFEVIEAPELREVITARARCFLNDRTKSK
jgi:predicted DNA-binding transcriptional regulator YafY